MNTIKDSAEEIKPAYVAIKDGFDLDVIVFNDNDSCVAFCSHHPEYSPVITELHTLKSALSLFGN